MKNTKTMYKGIDKLVTYVATCNTCSNAEVSNRHKTSRSFITSIRLIGWAVGGDNIVTCPECRENRKAEGDLK